MIPRELWQNIMHYGDFDRMPIIHWMGWEETRARWLDEGMPCDVEEHEYFDAIPPWFNVSVELELLPPFDEETFDETEEYRVFRDSGGVVRQEWKKKSCIPHYIDFTLKEARDWDEYKKRLQPDPKRIPENLDEQLARAEASGAPISVWTGSLMGWIRNWMGVVNMSYLLYDARDVYTDMVNTVAELGCWAIDQIVPRMKSPPDMGHCWEDICGKNGPLVSPDIFDECVAPGYRKIREKLEHYGIKLLSIDSDGDISRLVKHWLDAGVNVQFPIEIGTWNADPMEFRKKYGQELRIIGGLNKLALEKGPAEIDAEIERRIPLMKDGGFVVMPDHLITPGTSLTNYKYYLDRIRTLKL
ncbi:MAG: hypothetical protein GWP14_08535 [Actinobacteria bacterium]|nr:hypothetical protein [Actinomycetota bacterium]